MTLEGARLLQMHSSVSVASGMSDQELCQTALSYNSQFLTKQKQIQVWQLLYLSVIHKYIPDVIVQSNMSEQHLKTCAFIVR